MAMQSRIKVEHGDVFPEGAFVKGTAEPVLDFNAQVPQGQEKPQQTDKDTGLLMWQITVIDGSEDASKRDSAVTVKFAAKHRPIPVGPKVGPFMQVEFAGLTALPYVDDTNVRVEKGQIRGRGRIAWSFRADGFVDPAEAGKPAAKAGTDPKAAA